MAGVVAVEPIDYTPRFHFTEGGGAICAYPAMSNEGFHAALRGRPAPPALPRRRGLELPPRFEPLLVGLGRQPEVRLDGLPPLRELRLRGPRPRSPGR